MRKLRMRTLDSTTKSDLRRMAGLLAPFARPLVLAALLLMLSSLLTLALPWAIRWLVDTVFVSHNLGQLNLIALGLLALFVIQSGLSVGNTYLVARVGQRLIADLRLRIHIRVQGLPLRFFAERRTGEIVSRVSNDVTVVQAALTAPPCAPQGAAVVGCSHLMRTTHDRTHCQDRDDGALPGPPELAGGCTVTSQGLSAGLASLRDPDWPVEV